MTRTLIVHHSRSGYTRRVAQALAKRLDADVDEIRIVQPMAGKLGYLACAIEAVARLTPALRPGRVDAARYDLVLVGTPVWFWSLSSPVRSWLEAQRLPRGTRVAFFCTMGGAGAGRVFAAMSALARRRPVATLALTDREVDAGFGPQLEAFVAALTHGVPRSRRSAPQRLAARLARAVA